MGDIQEEAASGLDGLTPEAPHGVWAFGRVDLDLDSHVTSVRLLFHQRRSHHNGYLRCSEGRETKELNVSLRLPKSFALEAKGDAQI